MFIFNPQILRTLPRLPYQALLSQPENHDINEESLDQLSFVVWVTRYVISSLLQD